MQERSHVTLMQDHLEMISKSDHVFAESLAKDYQEEFDESVAWDLVKSDPTPVDALENLMTDLLFRQEPSCKAADTEQLDQLVSSILAGTSQSKVYFDDDESIAQAIQLSINQQYT